MFFFLSWLQVKGVIEHVMDAAGGQRRTSAKAVSVRNSQVTLEWSEKEKKKKWVSVK